MSEKKLKTLGLLVDCITGNGMYEGEPFDTRMRRFSMTIPANENYDADLLIDWSIKEIQSLQEQLEQAEKKVVGLVFEQTETQQRIEKLEDHLETANNRANVAEAQLTEANKQNHLFERLLVDITRVIFPHFERKDISETANYDTLPLHVRRKTQSLSAEVEELRSKNETLMEKVYVDDQAIEDLKAQLTWREYPAEKPEKTGRYLVQFPTGNWTVCTWSEDSKGIKKGWLCYGSEIVAWLPIPEVSK